MKLKRQREDVKWLKSWQDGLNCECDTCTTFRDVARRYLNLIRMAEEADRLYYKGFYTDRASMVLKDAEQ